MYLRKILVMKHCVQKLTTVTTSLAVIIHVSEFHLSFFKNTKKKLVNF